MGHQRVLVAVHHQAGQAVRLAVHQPVTGLRIEGVTQRQRLLNALLEEAARRLEEKIKSYIVTNMPDILYLI